MAAGPCLQSTQAGTSHSAMIIGKIVPLILSLPRITEPSPIFVQKGTPVIPTIRGFDPLVLPKSVQEISKALSQKVLEAALPSLVIIGPRMFSLAPNLQAQEGMVIHMPKPFPYKDSRRVP